MTGITDQFAVGLLNFAIGFGAGWFCRKPRTDNISQELRKPDPSGSDIDNVLSTVDEIEGAAADQEQSSILLRTYLNTYRLDVSDQLCVHTQAQRSIRRLLESCRVKLRQQDPERRLVPQPFTEGVESNLKAVCLLTEQLEYTEDHPGDSLSELFERLEQLEKSNLHLRQEIKSARETIEQQASRLEAVETAALEDFLTKLPNRRSFEMRFTEMKQTLERGGSPFCLLLIDLDHFKQVNDTYGHECGDAVLSVVAHVIRDVCRGQDHVSRYGGEEFVVLATDTDLEGAQILAERIRSRIESTATRHGDKKLQMTCSIGVAEAGKRTSADNVVELADQALYRAKDAGRNQVHIHNPDSALAPV